MVTESKPSLIVYKASAGSGKTFTLVSEYIKLLVANPQSYRQILAVTFTNKATEEMKMRILSQLYGIWRELPASRDYSEKIQKELNVSADYMAHQAGIALTNLLHNYSYFRVETIDSFFQSVLRNLARELELTANLRIGLNDVQVEEMAVDKIVDELSANELMLKWMLKYIMENIDDDRSWNVINQIKQFGKTIFRDYYKSHSRQLYNIMAEQNFFENFTADLRAIRKEALDTMKAIGDQFFDTLHEAGFDTEDLSYLSYGTSGVAGLFIKLQRGKFDESIVSPRVKEAQAQPEKWYKKTAERRDALHQLASGPLGRLLDEAIKQRPKQWKRYMSAELTLRHLNQLRLLESIEKKVRLLNVENNNFLLSDTQQLLHDLIVGSDSPFIFEKIGTQLEHIMIDEFQDTSTVQWANFKVLLQEVMSHEQTENLIVGDVKQSIYRWRSGDWRLLNNIKQEFSNANQLLKIETLGYNYRSQRNVVMFNNAFFVRAAQEEKIAAYQKEDVEQKVPEKKGNEGYVQLSLLPAADYQERTLSLLCEQIGELIGKGIAPTDIAILVRTNSQIPLIANYFMEYLPEVSIVSDEAFRLDASTAVLVIIQALRLLTNPDDKITEAYLAQFCSQQPLHEGNNETKLPKEFSEHRQELLSLPLYELAERLFLLFNLQRFDNQTAYLCAFYDQVSNYVSEQATDISAFLREWDERICATTIQSNEISGIRLISIHKSKGLEFPHVFIPFCDWRLEHRDILWCQPAEEPFNRLPIIPIDYSAKGMTGTVYEDSYNEEHGQNVVDNMNLLYVAFTRASKSLHVIGKRGARDSRSYLIERILPDVANQLSGSILQGMEQSNAIMSFEYGVPPTPAIAPNHTEKKEKEEKEKNVFLQQSQTLHLGIETYDLKVEFKQSNKSRDFTTPEEDEEVSQQNHYIQMGNVMHHVFSTIRTTADIDTALRQMELDGILYDAEITPERIKKMIDRSLKNPQVADWFSGRWTLYNECTILSTDEHGNMIDRRPDRVMSDGQEMVVVDFKFGRPNNDYHDQVREYMNLLKQMGHTHISGYLWYVYQNKIEKVKPAE